MRPVLAVFLAAAFAVFGCSEPPASSGASAPGADGARSPGTSVAPAAVPAAGQARPHLAIDGTNFVFQGRPFEWRGISAFRLVEQVAHGREAEAVAFLDWARAQKLTVIRVLAMATHLFELSPGDGLNALPRVLSLAADRGLFVEVVALADTAGLTVDLHQHVKAVAAIAAAHPNAVLEIANEPFHPTQDPRLHDPAFVKSLADEVPGSVPVALGSGDGNDGYAAAGRYATWHAPRDDAPDGWGHVLELATGAGLVSKLQKPLVSDEPIGAAGDHVPGRRDNEPARFAAAAAVTRLAGLGATFHYEGGLQGRLPAGRELECFNAWNSALAALGDLPPGGRFVASAELTDVGVVTGARAFFARRYDADAWVVAIDPTKASAQWRAGWRERNRASLPGVEIVRVSRLPGH